MASNNMNYVYNVEYFQRLKFEKTEQVKVKGKQVDKHIFSLNYEGDVTAFHFPEKAPLYDEKVTKGMQGYQSVDLYTTYPGLVIGMGYMHDLNANDALKCGFSFDFVTGLPYLPGSSIKGMLRSYFPTDLALVGADTQDEKELAEVADEDQVLIEKEQSKAAMIATLLGKEMSIAEVIALRNSIFEYQDTFLDVFPCGASGERLLEDDYLTPHKSVVKDPNPIHFIKVKPNVVFRFSFLLADSELENMVISAKEKLALFEKLICMMGVGAKTNVGYGRFSTKTSAVAPTVQLGRQ